MKRESQDVMRQLRSKITRMRTGTSHPSSKPYAVDFRWRIIFSMEDNLAFYSVSLVCVLVVSERTVRRYLKLFQRTISSQWTSKIYE